MKLALLPCLPFLVACSSSKSMQAANLSPYHVAWIAETATHTRHWVAGAEGNGTWVDAFTDEHGGVVLVARRQDATRKAFVVLFDEYGERRRMDDQPVRITPPTDGVVDVGVYFEETLMNSYPNPPDVRCRLRVNDPASAR